MQQGRVGRFALAVSICAGAFATGCEPPPTEGWRSELVSVNGSGTAGANRLSGRGGISDDGTKVLFTTAATDMGFPDSTNDGTSASIYLRDLTTGTTTRVNEAPDGTDGGNGSVSLARFAQGDSSVVFATTDSNLGPADTNGASDLYLHDLTTDTTHLLTAGAGGAGANGASTNPIVSGDGTTVAFTSTAGDLGPPDANGVADTYVLDLASGQIDLVSSALSGDAAGSTSGTGTAIRLSDDGTKVPFLSAAGGIVATPTTGTQAYVRDLASGTTALVSTSTSGAALPPGNAVGVSLAPTGGRAAVVWRPTTAPASDQIYVRDLDAATTTLVSANGSAPGNGRSAGPVFSPDGTQLAFASSASNLAPDDTNGVGDVFLHTEGAGALELVSRDVDGVPGNRPSSVPSFSPDGASLAFVSGGANLARGFPAISSELYLRDLAAGRTDLVSVAPTGIAGGNSTSSSPADFAADGRSILFASSSSTLDGRPVVPSLPSLFVARLTPYPEVDLGVTARMADEPPAGAAWAVELTVVNNGPADAGVVRLAYVTPYLGAGYSLTADRGTCTLSPTTNGGSLVDCTMPSLPDGATATVVLSGAYPLGGTRGDTVAAVRGVATVDPVADNNTALLLVADPATPPTTVTTITPPTTMVP